MQNTPKTWDIRWDFSEKLGNCNIWYKINLKSNNLGRKLQKIGFFSKIGTNFQILFLQIIICGYILAQKLKQLFYHTKLKVVIFHKLYLAQISTIIAENTENLPNSSSYTIEHKTVRNSHLLYTKIGIFSSATTIVLQTSVNCSYAKSSKQQLTAHTSIVKGDMTKCYKHAPFSSNALLCSLVLKSQLTLSRKYKTNKFYA